MQSMAGHERSAVVRALAMALATYALAFSCEVLGQANDPILLDIQLVQVKQGEERDFIALHAQTATQLAAAGRGPLDMWLEVRGGSGRFHIVSPGGGIEQAVWPGAASSLIESSERLTLQLYPRLSTIPVTGQQSEYLLLTFTTVRPGHHDTYEAWLENFLRPAFIATGINGASFTRVAEGDDTNQWVRSVPVDGMDDTSPTDFLNRLSNEDREVFEDSLDGLDAIVDSTESILLRHVPSASVTLD